MGESTNIEMGILSHEIDLRGLIGILPVASLAIILSNRGIRKALISLSRFGYGFFCSQ